VPIGEKKKKVVLDYKFIYFYLFMVKLCSEDKILIDVNDVQKVLDQSHRIV
jgi:hypothetical protein